VDGGIEFSSVVSGDIVTCGLTADGTAYCWGYNNDGQLGNGQTEILTNPTPTLVSGGLSFASIHPARWHTCGLTTEGEAFCWGANGMLGNGSWDNTAVPVPTLVSGGHKWQALSVNQQHSCGITTDQYVYCWGANEEGQLGNGSLEGSAVPTPVSGPQ